MENEKYFTCPIDFTIHLIGDKWSMWILWSLMEGPTRFGELKRKIPEITEKVLIQQLKKFERNHIISRKLYPEVPPKVEYMLTSHGESLKGLMETIRTWGEEHLLLQDLNDNLMT